MISGIRHDAVILLGRGGYSGLPRQQIERMVAVAQATGRYCLVLGAMVDQGDPALPQALDACAAAGVQRALVLPVFLPGDRGLQIWLAKVARRWQASYPAQPMEVIIAEGLGDHLALDSAVQAALISAAEGLDVRAQPPRQWERDPAGWGVLPLHDYQILVCRGPRCNALGAGACAAQLSASLAAHGLNKTDERVLVAQTGCLYPCNRGPVMTVYPDGVWYGAMNPAAVEQIVATHLVDGRVVEDRRIMPGAPHLEEVADNGGDD